jgi:5'(3')-deoxyribonucleotidase
MAAEMREELRRLAEEVDGIARRSRYQLGVELRGVSRQLRELAERADHSAGAVEMVSNRKRRVFVDMDGVIVDFDAYKTASGLTGDEVKRAPGAYLAMPAIPGAVEAVRSVIGMGFDVWIATKPPTGVPYAYSDKAAWIIENLPELKRKIIITHDKGLLGDAHDFLCDDRPHKANCERFAGSLLRFVDGYHWPQALDDLRAVITPQPKPTTGATKP